MVTLPQDPLFTSSAGPTVFCVHGPIRPSLVPRRVPELMMLTVLLFALPIFTPEVSPAAMPIVEGATSPRFSNRTLLPNKVMIASSVGIGPGTTWASSSTLTIMLL